MSKRVKGKRKKKKIKGMRVGVVVDDLEKQKVKGELADLKTQNEEWWSKFNSLGDDDKLDFFDAVLDTEAATDDFWVGGRPFDAFNDTFYELAHKGKLEECINLLEKFRKRKSDWYRKDYPFYDYKLVYYYAAREEREKLKEALKYFLEEPERDVDCFSVVLDTLRLYGFAEETYQLCKVAYPRLKDSEYIVPDAVDKLRQLVIFCMMREYIASGGEGEARWHEDIPWLASVDAMEDEELMEIKENLRRTIKTLRGEMEKEWVRADFFTTRDGCWGNVQTIGMEFVRYMHEKGFEWVTADMIREVALGYFGSKYEDRFLFKFSEDSFEEYLGMFLGFISLYDIRGMAAPKALGYFCGFLHEKEVLSEKELSAIEKGIEAINAKLRMRRERDAWKYKFLDGWE
jgi:hypothetical protein